MKTHFYLNGVLKFPHSSKNDILEKNRLILTLIVSIQHYLLELCLYHTRAPQCTEKGATSLVWDAGFQRPRNKAAKFKDCQSLGYNKTGDKSDKF